MSDAGPRFPGGATVVMPVYRGDDPALFERAVQSVFANTVPPDDFLLIADGPLGAPLDQRLDALRSRFSLRVLALPENVGVARALNAALPEVRTEWVLRADADDFNLPERFARQAAVVRTDSALGLTGSAILEVERDGSVIAIRHVPLAHEEIVRYARTRNPFNHMTVAYRADLARRVGGYPGIRMKEDYALWAALLRDGVRARNLPETLVHATAGRHMYRRRGGLRYARDEMRLQRHLVACGLKGPGAAMVDGVARGTIFLLPAALRGWIYRRFLRG